jgi:hypothetical protein
MKVLYSTILASLGGILALIGLTFQPLFGLTVVGAFLSFSGLSLAIGRLAFPEERYSVRMLFGFLGTLAILAVGGAAVYYLHALDRGAIAGLLILLPWFVFLFSPFLKKSRVAPPLLEIEKERPIDTASVLLLLAVIAFDLVALRWLFGAATAEAIRSPWDVVHPIYFLWLFLGSVSLVALCYRNRYHHFSMVAIGLHLFTVLSPALVVYSIGYGFDAFVHIATEKLIAVQGAVEPKPPYYLGQYAIVTILSRLLQAPVEGIDRMLVPALAAVFLPISGAYLLRRGFKLERHLAVMSALAVLLLPLSSFVTTTPQGLANVFALTAFLLGSCWLHDHRPALPFVALLALAAAAIHPLSGVPALLFVAFAAFFKLRASQALSTRLARVTLFAALFLIAVAAVPLMFRLNTGASAPQAAGGTPVAERLAALAPDGPFVETRFRPVLDFVQFAAVHHALLILALAAAGLVILWKNPHYRRTALASAGLAAALSISALALHLGAAVPGVIFYEQRNYGTRLFEIALLSLAPLVLPAVAWWWRGVRKTDASVRFLQALLLAAAVTAFAYAGYPRNDAFAASRGYSVSLHDIQAVRRIESAAGGEPYVVLANQSVSAAALNEFGFRTYYGDQYFYPIPTGGPLYRQYLEMVYVAPARETMAATVRMVGVRKAYFVINDYWTDAPRIIEAAKKTADAYFSVDDGKLFVFEYRF